MTTTLGALGPGHNPARSILLALALWPLPAAGQSGAQPTVLFDFYGGVTSGQTLWEQRQPLCVWEAVPGGFQCQTSGSGPVNDTLNLRRRLESGFALGGGVIYFFSPRVGVRADFTYAEESLVDQCTPAAPFQPDTEQKNERSCDSFTGDNASLNFVSLSGSLIVRPLPAAGVSPYVRVGAGLVIPTGETVAASGAFISDQVSHIRTMVSDSSSGAPVPFATAAVGLTAGSGLASRFQLEIGDAVIPLERLTGPADPAGRAPHSFRLTHNFSLTLGIALVFQGHRGHRY